MRRRRDGRTEDGWASSCRLDRACFFFCFLCFSHSPSDRNSLRSPPRTIKRAGRKSEAPKRDANGKEKQARRQGPPTEAAGASEDVEERGKGTAAPFVLVRRFCMSCRAGPPCDTPIFRRRRSEGRL